MARQKRETQRIRAAALDISFSCLILFGERKGLLTHCHHNFLVLLFGIKVGCHDSEANEDAELYGSGQSF